MVNMLKSAREMVENLNHLKNKASSIFIHGVGVVTDVKYEKNEECELWTFDMKLNNGVSVKSYYHTKESQARYLKEGDCVEFFGEVYTGWIRRRMEARSIEIWQLKLSNEERCFTDVFLWDVEIEMWDLWFCRYKRAVTDKHRNFDSCVIAIANDEELEFPDNETWAYGNLVKSGGGIILQLEKVME